jgi:hypothetical protein
MHAEDDHADAWILLQDLGSRIDSVKERHSDIHDHNIGVHSLYQSDRLSPIERFADDLQILVFPQQISQALSNDIVIICE